MRTFTLLLLCLLYLLPLQAQRSCATEDAIRNKIKAYPYLQQQRDALEQQLISGVFLKKQQQLLRGAAEPVVNIPVVVHIVLPNPAVVTDAQVYSQIDVLNGDYTGSNADTNAVPAAWKALIGNSSVNFCLAQRTPDGDPATGIVRVSSTHGPFDAGFNAGYEVKYTASGGSDAWDADKYLNIWVCNLSNSYLGVATPPDNTFPASEQGVVILYTAFGTTGSASGDFNGGRTATHEIGHYFGLRHIWGDDDGIDGSTARCTQDDGIDDTPLQGKRTYGCPSFPQTDICSNTSPGFMFMNYMDYTDDDCMHLFTEEQATRMRYVLDNLRTSLLTSDGCVPVNLQANDAAVASVTAPQGQICNTGFTPAVVLKNKGAQTLQTVQIIYRVDDGPTQTFNWSGSLTALKQTDVQLPAGTTGTGTHIITAYTALPNGVADDAPENDTATASFRYYNPATLPLSEGFESSAFPPDGGWDQWNPDESFTWELTRDAAKTGNQSIVMRNLGYATNGAVDDLYTPVVNAQGYDSVFLFFDVAAAVQSSFSSLDPWDSLQVLITTDCGQTMDSVYGKWGPNLVTRTTPTPDEFIPTASEWRRDSVNLTQFIRYGQFRVVFRNISNYENNIYLDNINIVTKATSTALRERGFTVTPNPTSDQVLVTFLEPPADLDAIALYNAAGQLVARQQASAINSSNRFTFNLVNEPNGVYFVKLIYRNRAKTVKIIKVQ